MAKSTATIGEIRKKITNTHELITTAYHESGHTIYALLHLMCVSSVCIYEDKQIKRIGGLTYYDCSVELSSIQDYDLLIAFVEAEIGNCYAGLITERVLFKSISGSDKLPMFTKSSSAEDNKLAASLIKQYNLAPAGKKRFLYKKNISKKVLIELCSHWEAINIIAHALFKHRRLDYEDLRNLLTKKTSNKKFWKEQFKKIDYIYNNKQVLDENDLRSLIFD